ncbi:hypothetical protein S7335_3695 [Synechococcus sp. PCC 7335]|nr:hypothetical protein S7335_3695 [Synechococcus sp. PCC 7335]
MLIFTRPIQSIPNPSFSSLNALVEVSGLEPLTSCLQSRRSTS